VEEFLHAGTISEAEKLKKSEKFHVIDMFARIYSVEPNLAKEWYDMDYRTVEDVRRGQKDLPKATTTGLDMFKEFEQSLGREDVDEILAILRHEITDIEPHAIVEPVGGYRRGCTEMDEVDVLIAQPGVEFVDGLTNRIVDHLKFKGSRRVGGMWDLVNEADDRCRTPRITPGHIYDVMTIEGVHEKAKLQDPRAEPRDDHPAKPSKAIHRKNTTGADLKTEKDVFNVLGLEYLEPTLRNAG
ncbi:hypothetical protein BDK51DRAFT_28972, partial [Blyttiomyces helicus]